MTGLEALLATRALLADEARWTRHALARAKDHETVVSACSPDAVAWCLDGAFCKVTQLRPYESDNPYHHAAAALEHVVLMVTGESNYAVFNDTHTHVEVLHLLDAALEYVEAGSGRDRRPS